MTAFTTSHGNAHSLCTPVTRNFWARSDDSRDLSRLDAELFEPTPIPMFLIPLALSFSASDFADSDSVFSATATFTADDRSDVTQFETPIPIDYTKTIVCRVTTSLTLVVGPTIFPGEASPRPGTYTTLTRIVRYMTTIFQMQKISVPPPTGTPVPTASVLPALKSAVFRPGILIGATFGILFVGGVIWTHQCRKPQFVPPEAVDKAAKARQRSASRKI
jgi:hypothetical protein